MKVTFSEHTYYEELISARPVMMDLGSCRGAFATHFKCIFPSSTIVMVEPSRTNFTSLKLEGEGIIKLNKALGSFSGEKITFYEDPSSEQNGSLVFNYFRGIPYEVETVSLDDLCSSYEKIDLVKMDVEGAEWNSLMSSSVETLMKISQLTVEFHDFLDPTLAIKSEEVVNRLVGLGFSVEYNPTTYMHGSKYYDSLFVNKNNT